MLDFENEHAGGWTSRTPFPCVATAVLAVLARITYSPTLNQESCTQRLTPTCPCNSVGRVRGARGANAQEDIDSVDPFGPVSLFLDGLTGLWPRSTHIPGRVVASWGGSTLRLRFQHHVFILHTTRSVHLSHK